MVDENFNCATCLVRTTPKFRDERKGCTKTLEKPVGEWQKTFAFYRCPASVKSAPAMELIRIHRLWGQGVLPYEGGLLDQPAKFVDAMELIGALQSEHFDDMRKKLAGKGKTRDGVRSGKQGFSRAHRRGPRGP